MRDLRAGGCSSEEEATLSEVSLNLNSLLAVYSSCSEEKSLDSESREGRLTEDFIVIKIIILASASFEDHWQKWRK